MNFEELLSKVGIEVPERLVGREVSAIVTDSRRAVKNCIFVCLCGTRCDGHDHIEEAIAAGAEVIVAEKVRGVREGGAALTLVNNTKLCASLLYNEWYGRPAEAMKIIGVTGTNGKTSVACMMRSIFEQAGYSCGLVGTLGVYSNQTRLDGVELSVTNMTTPDPADLFRYLDQMRRDNVEYVFMEVSSHALSQYRVAPITFDCAVFTNLAPEHLDFHKDMESYYKAKEILFAQCRRAIVNTDDAAGGRLLHFLEQNEVPVQSCSRVQGDFCALLGNHTNEGGIEYIFSSAKGQQRVILPNFSANFQIENSLIAASVAESYGISRENILSAFLKMDGVCGRMERLLMHPKQQIEVFIDYAHTPDALEKVLSDLRQAKSGDAHIVLIFGCGGDRDRSKRKPMGQIASRLADFIVVSADNSRSEPVENIISDIMRGIDKEKPHAIILDRRLAIRRAIFEFTSPGDVLLIAGKGHERYEIDAFGVRPFDEREIVREALDEFYANTDVRKERRDES